MSTILVTGANRGLGLEFVKQYAAEGCRTIACCRSAEKALTLLELAKQSPTIQIEPLDVTNQTQLYALTSKLRGDPIDILINNAGVSEAGNTKKNFGCLEARSWEEVLRVNAISPLLVSQAFLENIRRGGHKKIIMISSVRGSLALASSESSIAYRSSKAALNMAMRSAAHTVRDEGICMVSIHPGWVATEMGGSNATLSPEESVRRLRGVIETISMNNSGQFLNYDGHILPW